MKIKGPKILVITLILLFTFTPVHSKSIIEKKTFSLVIRVPEDYGTIQEAVDAANNDDVIVLSPGTYSLTETVFINKRITLASEFINSNEEFDVNATVITSADDLDPLFLFTAGAKNAICTGLTFRNAHKQLTIECEFMEVTHCKFYDNNSDALSLEGAGGYIAYNYFENCGDEAIDADDSLDWIAEYNTIINPEDDGFEIRLHNNDYSTRTHIIRHNFISGADEDGIQLIDYDGDSGREFQIHHNVIRNSAMVGLGCTINGNTIENLNGSYMEEKVFVYNNVFDNNDHGITGANNMLVFNNIISNSSTVALKKLDKNSIANYNCLFNNGIDFLNATFGPNNIFVDPLFNTDYSLQDESPCIDTGIKTYAANGLSQSLDGGDIIGNLPDRGAIEFDDDILKVNLAPTVDVGPNQVILIPYSQINLVGEVSDDNLPENGILSTKWTLESGPEGGKVIFLDDTSIITNVSFSKQGNYELKLTADDGEKISSDIITIFFVNDFNDTNIELVESKFIEAEDYRYLVGSAEVLGFTGASNGKVVTAPIGDGTYAYSEYRLVTFSEGTYFVWINATGLDKGSNSLKVSFNDLQDEISIEAGTGNRVDNESWVMVAFENIPEGVYPLRIIAAEQGVSWDRIFITTDENEKPFSVNVESLSVYPVPNDGNFTVGLNSTESTKIQVFNMQGMLVYTTSVSDTIFVPIEFGIVESGIYVVKIEYNEETIIKNIIIK